MARYALPNMSDTGRKVVNRLYHTMAYNFENLVFLFIGIGVVGFDLAWDEMGIGLFVCVFFAISFARYANIRLMSKLANKYRT